MDQDQLGNKNNNRSRKRARDDDSASDSPEGKVVRVDSVSSEDDSSELARIRDELDAGCVDHVGDPDENPGSDSDYSGIGSPEAKRIQDDLLNITDESDDPAIQGLESLIRSFEEEILVPRPAPPLASEAASFSGEPQPELGYLFEASDDELGLPPTFYSGEEGTTGPDDSTATNGSGATCLGQMLGFEEGIPSYDSFEFGLGGDSDSNGYNGSYNDGGGDFVALGGLFDHSDDYSLLADISGLQWQPESMPAL